MVGKIPLIPKSLRAGFDMRFRRPPYEVIYSEEKPTYYEAQQMLGRAARDLELPEAYLFTKGEPGIDEKAIKARIGLMPVKLFHDGARCFERLFELARAKM